MGLLINPMPFCNKHGTKSLRLYLNGGGGGGVTDILIWVSRFRYLWEGMTELNIHLKIIFLELCPPQHGVDAKIHFRSSQLHNWRDLSHYFLFSKCCFEICKCVTMQKYNIFSNIIYPYTEKKYPDIKISSPSIRFISCHIVNIFSFSNDIIMS